LTDSESDSLANNRSDSELPSVAEAPTLSLLANCAKPRHEIAELKIRFFTTDIMQIPLLTSMPAIDTEEPSYE
jgi:hypothetical protein